MRSADASTRFKKDYIGDPGKAKEVDWAHHKRRFIAKNSHWRPLLWKTKERKKTNHVSFFLEKWTILWCAQTQSCQQRRMAELDSANIDLTYIQVWLFYRVYNDYFCRVLFILQSTHIYILYIVYNCLLLFVSQSLFCNKLLVELDSQNISYTFYA